MGGRAEPLREGVLPLWFWTCRAASSVSYLFLSISFSANAFIGAGGLFIGGGGELVSGGVVGMCWGYGETAWESWGDGIYTGVGMEVGGGDATELETAS
jgi:hypothetical protein